MFKRSGPKCDRLRELTLEKFEKELTMKPTYKVRWNSIFAQIERFLIIKESIAQVLHEYKREELEYL